MTKTTQNLQEGMNISVKEKIQSLIIAILIPLVVGVVSSLLTVQNVGLFEVLVKPPLSPPGWLFSVVWPILYIMMGISSYLISTSSGSAEEKSAALRSYALQLAFNFFWSIIFFNFQFYGLAFVWLVIMWVLIARTIKLAYPLTKAGALLLVPYLLWVTFAGYLNLGIYLLNR